ncbi:hypothetical protein CPB84DRAFT_287977 [Gymnopilus junonius]|uniref:Uncharacterized protein n=1 Tax=Gymnopilus junonius TaxID=109634 RepID=A0A9P5NEB7_GYMJU|nr:hypothetical protein CPB84DRAFT_287977 [Gymnopilus junonius]
MEPNRKSASSLPLFAEKTSPPKSLLPPYGEECGRLDIDEDDEDVRALNRIMYRQVDGCEAY